MSKIYITYWKTKIKKFSVEVRLFEIKYLKTKTKTQNLEIYMKFSLKIGLLSLFFFGNVIVKWKLKLRNNRGVLEDFKRKEERKTRRRKEKRKKEEKEKKRKRKKRKTNFFPSLQRQWVAFLGAWCPLLAIRSCFVNFVQRSIVLSMN